MSASVWNPNGSLVVDAESSNQSQAFTVNSDGQVTFTLTSFTYVPGSNSIACYRNGQRVIKDVDWAENSDGVTVNYLSSALKVGEIIEVVAVLGATSANVIAAQASASAAALSAQQAAASAATIDTAHLVSKDSATGSANLPAGTTAQRTPIPSFGATRANSDLNRTEWWNGTAWVAMSGGATGGGNDAVFYENDQIVTADHTIAAGKNAMTKGPLTIANGVTITISNGSEWGIM
jgi:hypothetical protein